MPRPPWPTRSSGGWGVSLPTARAPTSASSAKSPMMVPYSSSSSETCETTCRQQHATRHAAAARFARRTRTHRPAAQRHQVLVPHSSSRKTSVMTYGTL